jgi:hypothetical protein
LSKEAVKFANRNGKWISESGLFELRINQLNSRFKLK